METFISRIFHKLEEYHENGSVNLVLDSIIFLVLIEKHLSSTKINAN
jgi:hypothetical protein